jgi:hypothetical protein
MIASTSLLAMVVTSTPLSIVPSVIVIPVKILAITATSIAIVDIIATTALGPPSLLTISPFFRAFHGISINATRMRRRLVVVLSSVGSWRMLLLLLMMLLLIPRLIKAQQTLADAPVVGSACTVTSCADAAAAASCIL